MKSNSVVALLAGLFFAEVAISQGNYQKYRDGFEAGPFLPVELLWEDAVWNGLCYSQKNPSAPLASALVHVMKMIPIEGKTVFGQVVHVNNPANHNSTQALQWMHAYYKGAPEAMTGFLAASSKIVQSFTSFHYNTFLGNFECPSRTYIKGDGAGGVFAYYVAPYCLIRPEPESYTCQFTKIEKSDIYSDREVDGADPSDFSPLLAP